MNKRLTKQLPEHPSEIDPFRVILESVDAGILIIDVEAKTIIEANRAAYKMIGCSKEELIGQVCHNYICPNDKGNCPVLDQGKRD